MCFVSRFTSDRLRREKDARPPPPCCLGEYACKTRLDFYNPILVDISSSSCFQGGVFPKGGAIECVLSRVLQFNVHGYIKTTLLPDKTGGLHSRKKRQMESN